MSAEHQTGGLDFIMVLAGTALAMVSAVVPHYSGAHQLLFGVFLAGFTPWLLYGIAAALFRGPLTTLAGALLLILHGTLVMRERFSGGADYADGMIYYLPLLFSVLLLPLLARALREPWRR